MLAEIARIAKAYKPFTFFGVLDWLLYWLEESQESGFILDYLEDEYVNKVPTAILATGFMLLGFGSYGDWNFAEHYKLPFSRKYASVAQNNT